ncbi:MAG: HXXEE domain-containing protein [Promethearchaeota archaeon]|nr:MAG: HXXEE domain-containing protein [Candidatus Lokiarchaeota archaeon]
MNESKMKNFINYFTYKRAVWLAPLFYLLHIIEEAVFGFHIFMNKYRGWNTNMLQFLIMNAIIMIVYLILIIIVTIYPNRVTVFFQLTGLLAAQFFNAFFHLYWTILFGEYCPGLITGIVLYIPFNICLVWIAYKEEYITKTSGVVLFVLGATLMILFSIEGLAVLVLFGSLITAIIIVLLYYIKTRKSN